MTIQTNPPADVTYHKFAPNAWVAKTTHGTLQPGDIIQIPNKYGDTKDHIIWKNITPNNTDFFYYSIIRADGENSQTLAEKKAEKLAGYQANAEARASNYYQASQEGRDFLSLAEPIKIGHHSESKHRNLIDRNWNRMAKSVAETDKANSYNSRIAYWDKKTTKIDLSMPESLEYFAYRLDQKIKFHKDLKERKEKKEHTYSLTYAKKDVNEYSKLLELAKQLWERI